MAAPRPRRLRYARRRALWYEIADTLPRHDLHVDVAEHLLVGLLRPERSRRR